MGRPLDFSPRYSGTHRMPGPRAMIEAVRFGSTRFLLSADALAAKRRCDSESAACFQCGRTSLYRRMLRYNRAVPGGRQVGACATHRDALMALNAAPR